jgi:hypothetical protein
MTDYKKNRHACFKLTYHLVIATKYRHKCMNNDVMKNIMNFISVDAVTCWTEKKVLVKVNPVIAEMMNMVNYQVFGCDTTVTSAGTASQLELNVMMPVMAYNLLFAIQIMSNGLRTFTDKSIVGMEANEELLMHYAELTTAVVTGLSPLIGYERAAQIAQKVHTVEILLQKVSINAEYHV